MKVKGRFSFQEPSAPNASGGRRDLRAGRNRRPLGALAGHTCRRPAPLVCRQSIGSSRTELSSRSRIVRVPGESSAIPSGVAGLARGGPGWPRSRVAHPDLPHQEFATVCRLGKYADGFPPRERRDCTSGIYVGSGSTGTHGSWVRAWPALPVSPMIKVALILAQE